MTSVNFETTILVSNTPIEVFNAINNVRGWWQGEIEGETNKLNGEFSYRMPGHHYSKQQIVELIPGKKVTWNVIESKLKFEKENEWTGTSIIFEIRELNDKTELHFSHIGLVPAFQCYGDCSWAWGQLVTQSLFSLITTGKGTNVFG